MSNYYVQTYGAFIEEHEKKVLQEERGKYLSEYARKWNEAVTRLIESGADLSRIVIVGREVTRK